MNPRSRIASLAALVGGLALVGVAVGALGARLGALSPFLGFRVFALSLGLGGLLALVLGLIGLVATRAVRGVEGRSRAWLGLGAGLALSALLASLLASIGEAPAPIHDVTTDLDDPPEFVAAADDGRDLGYPHGRPDTPTLQRESFPDLASIETELTADAAFERARMVAEELGWTVVWANAGLGHLEAYETSGFFRFVDDVVVRVRPAAAGSRIDLRSTSRVGVSDLGANAARIRRFTEAFAAAGG